MSSRVHLTNGKEKKVVIPDMSRPQERATYDVTFCGRTFLDFPRGMSHAVYHYSALQKLIDQGARDSLCPGCITSPELALDLLGDV